MTETPPPAERPKRRLTPEQWAAVKWIFEPEEEAERDVPDGANDA